MLELNCVRVGYGENIMINEVTAKLPAGALVTLIGANGAGKSTLLRVLSGVMSPMSGNVTVEGKNLTDVPKRELARLVSIVNTEKLLVDGLTVCDVVSMGRYPYTGFMGRLGREDETIVMRAMEATGVARLGNRNVSSLSDGERQKVMIARAVAQQTPVILLDEPTAFLDVASRVEVLSLLRELAVTEHKGVLLSSHDVPSALELSDYIWLLPGDGTLRVDTPNNLIKYHENRTPGNALDALFAGRAVKFDAVRRDYVKK